MTATRAFGPYSARLSATACSTVGAASTLHCRSVSADPGSCLRLDSQSLQLGGQPLRALLGFFSLLHQLDIRSESFPVRAMPMVLWVGGTALGSGRQSPDLSEVSAVTFDESPFVEDAPIAVSYGERGHRELLPEKLTLSDTRR